MRVRLIRDARIKHSAGEIVEVSPAEFNFLVSVGSAEPIVNEIREPETPESPAPERRTAKKK